MMNRSTIENRRTSYVETSKRNKCIKSMLLTMAKESIENSREGVMINRKCKKTNLKLRLRSKLVSNFSGIQAMASNMRNKRKASEIMDKYLSFVRVKALSPQVKSRNSKLEVSSNLRL